MKLPLLLGTLLLAGARPALAQLTLINPGDQPVQVALGFQVDKGLFKGWNTKGWLTLAPHDSLTELPNGINGNSFCYFLRVPGSDWRETGGYPLFLHPTDAFAIAGAANEAPLTLNQNVRKAGFAKVDLPAGQRAYRLRLPPPNATQGGLRSGAWLVYLDRDKEEVSQLDQASYVRRLSYQRGVPAGLVRDYAYPGGVLQWDGKLLREHPAVYHGSCVSYDEAGRKREERIYQDNGQLAGPVQRWDAAGQPVAAAPKKYRTVRVLLPQQGYLVSYFNPGRSRTVIPVTLPAGTVAWYYEFAAFREPAQLQAAQGRFQLAADLTRLLDQSGLAKLAVSALTQPPGGNICNVYLLQDDAQRGLFEAKQEFTYLEEGSRTSLTSAVVPVPGSGAGTPLYLGLHNPDNLYGIHYALEVLAVVEDPG